MHDLKILIYLGYHFKHFKNCYYFTPKDKIIKQPCEWVPTMSITQHGMCLFSVLVGKILYVYIFICLRRVPKLFKES